MEQIGQTVLEVGERVKRAAEERRAALPDCRDHPGQKISDCAECLREQAERERAYAESVREDSRIQAVMEAHDSCSAFPARFAEAITDHPNVMEWAATFKNTLSPPLGLVLLGPTGTGKTWQAYGALRAACLHPVPTRIGYRRRQWKAAPFADIMAQLRPRSKVDSEAIMDQLKSVDLLLVDDLAAAKGSEWVEEQTYRLINGRYEAMLPTIFTTNLGGAELREAIGDRIASRLVETCVRVALSGEDRRRIKPREASA